MDMGADMDMDTDTDTIFCFLSTKTNQNAICFGSVSVFFAKLKNPRFETNRNWRLLYFCNGHGRGYGHFSLTLGILYFS